MSKLTEACELNNVGTRITWVRGKLGLNVTETALCIDVPLSTYIQRESGVRTAYYEEFIIMSEFFDARWQLKYEAAPIPYYKDVLVKKITPMFLMYGQDNYSQEFDAMVEEFEEYITTLEMEHLKRELRLKKKLSDITKDLVK